MNIAVTGGAGRLGTVVARLAVARGHRVVAIDREPPATPVQDGITTRSADLNSCRDLESAVADCDALIHLAAYTNPSAAPEPLVHHNNVMASYNALRAAETSGIRRVCLASSVNALGGVFSRQPRYDYFPVDEGHPCYAEDSYSLSKWIAEQQAAAFARRVPDMSVSCLRLHALREREEMGQPSRADGNRKQLWGYTPLALAARACLGALTTGLGGAEVYCVVAADTCHPEPSMTLRDRYYPSVPVRGDLSGRRSFFDCAKARKVLLSE